MMLVVDHFAEEAETIGRLSEQEQTFSVRCMGCDGEVASLHHHVADLAISEIFEYTIIAGAVSITVFKTFLACDNNHERVLRRSDNATLLLAAEFGVDIGAAVIDLSFLKAPAHVIAPKDQPRVVSLPWSGKERKDVKIP